MSSDDGLTARSRELRELARTIHALAVDEGPVSISFANGKGGVGKTTMTCNVADELARVGLRVLVLGLCLQVDMASDFGVTTSDTGWSVVQSVLGKGEPDIVKDVRPNLDVIFGGPDLMMLETFTGANERRLIPGGDAVASFKQVMLKAFDPYDVVLIDFPPGEPVSQSMGLSVTDWIVVPMKSDKGSRDGLVALSGMVSSATDINPDVRYLGAVMFAHTLQATSVYKTWKDKLAETGIDIPVLASTIRHSERVAQDTRENGLLARELADEADQASRDRIQALKESRETPRATFSRTTSPIAGDYEALAHEILTRIVEAHR